MARSIFGFGPMGAIPDQPKAPDPAEQRKAIESQATQFQVPANVLMALQESGIADTGTAAQKIAADMKAGKTVDQIVGPELMNRAYDIADKLYPKPVAPDRPKEASVLRDAPAAIGSSIAGAAGSALKGVGEFGAGVADAINDTLINPVIEGFTGEKDVRRKAPNPLGAVADHTFGDKGLGGYLDSFVSEEVKQDMADLTDPNADLFDPSTWRMGKRPTVRGAIYSAVDVFGSMAPIVVVGALTRSPSAAAAAGGAMSGGDAATSAAQVIDQMAATKLEDGRSQLEAQSSTYQRLIAGGMDPQEALRTTKRKAEQQAAIYASIPGALGGAATQKILAGTEGVVARLPWGGRVAGTAVQSGMEEGIQEAAEGMAGRLGVNEGAGLDQSITAGTLNEAVLGALGGGPMGAMGGALSSRHLSYTPADGSVGGEVAPLEQGNPRSGLGGATAEQLPPAPLGPISQIAAAAPDMTPAPEAPAPAPFFPDQKPGNAIRLYDPESDMIHDATVLGENENGIDVRIEGGVVTLSPEEFDRSRVDAGRMDEEAKAALKDSKTKKPKVKVPAAVENYVPTPPEPSPEEVSADQQQIADDEAAFQARIDADQAFGEATGWGGAPEDAAPSAPVQGSLSKQAQAAVQPPVGKTPESPITPPDALARARSIEDHAKDHGWNARMKKQHAAFMEIANNGGAQDADVAQIPAGGIGGKPVLDGGAGRSADASGNGADLASGNDGSDGVSERGRVDAGEQPILQGGKKGASDAAQTGEYASALNSNGPKDDADKPLRDHADANPVIEDTLPGRQKQGVPMASVKVGKAPDGSFMVRSSMHTPTGGFGRPMGGKYSTADDALHAGAAEIRKQAKSVLRPGALKNGYNEQDQADARKILKWLGDRGPEKPMLDDGLPADLGSKAEADAQVAADDAKVQEQIAQREKDMADVVDRPRKPVTPMEADPGKRIQPDMFGGAPVTETVMAKKEREKREWGRLLAIAEHGKSSDDMDFQGRKALIRPGKVVLRAGDTKSDLDRTIDTQGMDRDEISAAVRGALRELDRVAPLPAVAEPLPQQQQPAPVAAVEAKPVEAPKEPPAPDAGVESKVTITNIREKAAVLRGLPEDARPDVGNLSLKWDAKEGGFIFSRKHADAVLEAAKKTEAARAKTPLWRKDLAAINPFPDLNKEGDRPATAKTEPAAKLAKAEKVAVDADAPMKDLSKLDFDAWDDRTREDGQMSPAKREGRAETSRWAKAIAKILMDAGFEQQTNEKGKALPLVDFSYGMAQELDETSLRLVTPGGNALHLWMKNGWSKGQTHTLLVQFTGTKPSPKHSRPFIGGNQYLDANMRPSEAAVQLRVWAERADAATAPKQEPTPTATEVKAAAAEADKAPTEAQKEAGNYKMGHIGWNGLDLTIETAKGALRKGKDKDGEEWSVKMPADYGYIKGTTGADGDHVDFYMGPNPESDVVVVIDQVDATSRAFDEHKVMLGFPAFGPARISYEAGFSDGKGADRMGAHKVMTVAEFKDWLANGDHKKPIQLAANVKPEAATAKTAGLKGLTEAENAKLAALQARFKDKMKSQINSGLDPEMVAIAVEMGALYVKSGIRRFRALVESMMDDMGLTLEQAQPYARNAYNHLRGDMELNGDDIADMDSDSEVIAEVRKMRAAEAKAPKVAPHSPEPAKGDNVGATKEGDASNDAGPAIHESSSSELEGTSPKPVSDVSAGEPAGTRGAEGEQGGIRPGGQADAAGDAAPRGGRAGATGDGEPAAKRGVKAKRAKKAAVNPDESGPITADAPKVQAAKVNVPAVNYTITDDLRLGQGGVAEKFSDNLAAIRTLKQIQRENRRASPAEQAVLARYVGWGGMKNAFRVAGSKGAEGIAKGWEKRAAELEEMLEPAEYAAARNSTKAAHYTSQSVVNAIWEGARRLGFRGGAVLEPSVGSGNFLGLMPQDLRGPSRVTAVEYDALTAGIAKLLYPASNVLHSGFEKLPIPKGSQSLAIGNPPFGKDQLFFRHSPEINRKTIHNQFFLASMDSLAPGGLLAMVVSHYLMDTLDSTNRLAMAERAELLHAIRLPSNAFEENANTEVVTDILFFRKHDASDDVSALNAAMYHGKEAAEVRAIMGKKEATRDQIDRAIELMAKNARWVGAETINDPAGSGETINVNSYFLRNKGKVIGKLDASGTMNGRAGLNVTMENPKAFTEQLNAAIEAMQEAQPVDGIVERTQAGYAAMSESLALAARNAEPGEVRVDENGALKMVIDAETLGDSKSMMLELDLNEDTPWHPDYSYRADRKWQITEDVTDENGKPVKQKKADGTLSTRNQKTVTVLDSTAAIPAKRKWGAKRIELLKALLPIKHLMKRQFVLESQDGTDQQIEGNRAKLNAAYDAFVKKHGKLNAKATAEIAFQMPDGALALGAEVVGKDGSISKSAIMSERITRPFVMAERADTPADALAVSLSERGAIDIDRVAGLLGVDVEKAAEMLSGGEKPLAFLDPETEGWETADAYLSGTVKRKLYAARQAGLTKNVNALEAVQPKQWDSTQISPNIGSTWIPPSVYRDFLKHLGYSSASMSFMSVTNTFSGDVDGEPRPVWKTTGRAFSPSEIVFRLLNSLPMKVTYTDSEKRTHVDEQASVESQQKATEISSEFLDWVYQDAGRRELLVETFNERYNTRVIRQRDGAHLKMPTKGPKITLRRHQVNAIWRGITDKAVLYDHAVGAGKTFTAIARIMERRRMGLSRKPMVVVPNHLIEQWAADFKVLYPGANVLAAGKADFETNNRRRLFAKIASGDYDAVIIGHSSFNFIDIDPSTEMRFLEEELRAANEAIKEAEEAAAEEGLDTGWRKPMGVAEAERLVTKIQTRLDRLREGKRDRLLTFEEMGIDDLTVDESHEFKNLAYSSRLQNVSGMGNKNGSAKATNLHLKARSLHERDGTSMAFLSGTPISNSVSEMYLILRNLVPNELREMGMENFDAWRSAFVSVATQWEPTEAGGLKEVARLGREWTNMRALMDLYYSVSDAVPIEDVIKNYPLDNDGKRFPIPPVKSKEEGRGDREMVAVKPDEAQRSELRAIVSGFERLPGMEVKERNSERLRLMDRARKVSLDARAANPHAKVADGTGKIGATVDNVMRLYRKWNEDKGTQVIFLDRSVPKARGAEKFVAEYDDLLDKLRVAEVDEKEKDIEKLVEKLAKYDPNEVEAQRVAIAGGWNAYGEIRSQLVAKGIPADEIAFVQDANTDAEKKELFERVNSGEVRVILGSTPRMGAGTNIQKRLVGLHHVDVTWKPSDIEQREGRIVRFGNELLDKYGFDLFQVEVLAYATEMTVDAKMWALNATKLKAINGIRKYDGSFNMEFEDEESANMAEMAALATGNPLMVERVMLDGELKKMDMSRRTFNNRMNGMRAELDRANKTIANADGQVAVAKGFATELRTARNATLARSALRKIDINGKILKDMDSARAALNEEIARQRAGDENARWSVQIDGNKVTTADTANAEITRIFGTPGFEAAVKGKTEVSFARASAAIADQINRTVAAAGIEDSVAVDGITILGMPVEVDSYMDAYSRGGTDRQVTFSFLHGGKEAWSTDQPAPKGTITQQGVRAALDKIFDRMTPEQQEGNAAYYAEEKVRAIEKKPELEAEMGKPWPLAEDYEQKKARQAEVIALLEKASVNDQLDESDGEEGYRESRFNGDQPGAEPVATLTGDELGDWEDIRQLGKKAEAWYRDNLLGRKVTNDETGWSIGFTARGAKKIGSRKGDDLFRMVPALREIIEKGRIVASEADSKGRPEIKAVHKIAATVMLDGVAKDVVATIRETNEGRFHYDLGRDMSDGARHSRFVGGETAVRMGKTQVRSPALEGSSVEINLDHAPQEINQSGATVPSNSLKAVSEALAAEVSASGLDGKVTVSLVRGLLGSAGVPIQGRQRGANIAISESAAHPVGVMRHEIVHALRDAALWGQPYGLFTSAEWKALVAAARADKGLMARVAEDYSDLAPAGQIEEAVAEMYREWAGARSDASPAARIFNKVASFLRAMASALRGEGFEDAGRVMERIASGKVGGRGPDGGGGGKQAGTGKEMRPSLTNAREKFKGMIGSENWKDPAGYVKNLVTDAMSGKGDYSALALVPGRALFSEMGKRMLAAKAYLRTKEDMDSLRNDWHHAADAIAQKWLKLRNKSPRENDVFMDLMHRSTLAGIDPSQKDTWKHAMEGAAKNRYEREGDNAPEWVQKTMDQIAARKSSYRTLQEEFDQMSPEFQALYGEVLAAYGKMGDDFEKAVLHNIANATKIGLKRAERAHRKELERIQDEGLEGEERDQAIESADAVLKKVKRRGGFSAKARINTLRKTFESNRLKGPYFPLARFGNYFATVRDENGAVTSFSRFEKESQQQAFVREQKAAGAQRIEVGVMSNKDQLKGMVDPTFVADVENMLAETGASDDVMDAVWQRWLETLPDQSIRTSKIHRKGRSGFHADAFRAFGKHMFHGAHQLARLEYGLPLEEHINDAEDEARQSADPNRAGLLVNEMRKRHAFTMNPTGSSAVASMSGAAFVWYLGASPAAALANISQTTVVGIPLMAARFRKAGVTGSTKALGRASKDFFAGRGKVTSKIAGMPVWTDQWTAENSPNLTGDELMAMKEAVRRGTIDKTQAHDLASVAESGIEYSATREKWMKKIGWFFHQAERFNREVTFLANYRLAREDGLNHGDAIDAAADITWKIHFDYQNTSRPRFMQNDIGKALTIFRQFTVNLLWRMFRDTHQALHGATKEDRAEARMQLVGITLSMMAHAGIRGTWGYGLLMMLLGMLAPGADDDDLKEWLQDALLMEGDGMGVAAWNYAMGAALNGVPGQVLGIDLSERIGMPNLWFRDAQNNLEGSDLASHYATEILGPVYGIADGFFRGASLAADDNWWRGAEAASPKVIRDAMKAARYSTEGVLTLKGDVLADGIGVLDALKQVNGFTPAKIAKHYNINSRLRDRQDQIVSERSSIQREAGDAALAGEQISEKTMRKILDFNERYPEYPITGDTIRQSARGRQRATQRNEFGVTLNSKLNDRLRGERAPAVYQ
jgi:N12 class adenine-specific DNA methylase